MGINRPIAANDRQQTGNTILDRIQDNVRELVARVKFILSTLSAIGLGSIDIELPNRDYTMTLEEAANVHWSFRGALTAARRVIVPAAALRSRSYVRWASNQTTGGFALTFVTTKGGATATVNAGVTRPIIIKNNELAPLI